MTRLVPDQHTTPGDHDNGSDVAVLGVFRVTDHMVVRDTASGQSDRADGVV